MKEDKIQKWDIKDTIILFRILSLLFLVVSLPFFLLSYNRIQSQELGVDEGYQSWIPQTYVTANFTPANPLIASETKLVPLICRRFRGCIPCKDCIVDIYVEIDSIRQIQFTNLTLHEKEEISFIFKHDPMWAYITLPNYTKGWIRIPKPNFWQNIQIMARGFRNKLDPISIDGLIASFILLIISLIYKLIVKIFRYFLDSIKQKSKRP